MEDLTTRSRFVVGAGFLVLIACGPSVTQPSVAYVIPAEMTLQAEAARGPEGEVTISGSTNFPDGFKLEVEIESGRLPLGAPKEIAGEERVIVEHGAFRTKPLWLKVPYEKRPSVVDTSRRRPIQAGKYNIRFVAYFDTWQTGPVYEMLGGNGGRELHGSILKNVDTDVVDSEKKLDYRLVLTLPSLSHEAEAITLVKGAVLTIPDHGRSALDIEDVVNGMMATLSKGWPGDYQTVGWSASAKDSPLYEVTFRFVEKGDSRQAVWSANLGTRKVKYINSAAKSLSWSPPRVSGP
jgi:hypothetical protein